MADTGIFAWLDRASRCGDVDVERSAEMLKNYYQGVGPEPEYGEQATIAKNAAVRFDSELCTAAGAVVARWDSPKWKDEPHTAIFINRLRAALVSRPAEVDDWISVDDRMPGNEHCLAAYVNAAGKHRVIRAMYADQFQIDAGEDAIDQGNCEYNEADDTFYLKAGWLECIDNWDDYSSIYVTEGTVTHWRRLPASPSNTTNKEK